MASRPVALEGWLNQRIYHPLAHQLALRLAPTVITPNAVSVAGGFCVVAAAFAYTQLNWPYGAFLGLALHLFWHVLDGADGDLARMTGKAGPMGEIVDGIADYLSHIVLYCMLAQAFYPEQGTIIWMAAIAAGASRVMQANHCEVRRREYQWWMFGRPWLRNQPMADDNTKWSILALMAAPYLWLANATGGSLQAIERLHHAARYDPEKLAGLRRSMTEYLHPLLPALGLLGANHRTIILGAAMIAGNPIWFFLYEIILLNLVLLWSVRAHSVAVQKMLSWAIQLKIWR